MFNQTAAEVATLLETPAAVTIIEDALVTELQAVDPNITITSLQVVADAVIVTTTVTTAPDDSHACPRSSIFGTLFVAAAMLALLVD